MNLKHGMGIVLQMMTLMSIMYTMVGNMRLGAETVVVKFIDLVVDVCCILVIAMMNLDLTLKNIIKSNMTSKKLDKKKHNL